MEASLNSIGKKGSEQFTGTICKWFDERGFGFVEHQGKQYFVHITKMVAKKAPTVGDTVCFKIMNSLKGLQAVEVEVQL